MSAAKTAAIVGGAAAAAIGGYLVVRWLTAPLSLTVNGIGYDADVPAAVGVALAIQGAHGTPNGPGTLTLSDEGTGAVTYTPVTFDAQGDLSTTLTPTAAGAYTLTLTDLTAGTITPYVGIDVVGSFQLLINGDDATQSITVGTDPAVSVTGGTPGDSVQVWVCQDGTPPGAVDCFTHGTPADPYGWIFTLDETGSYQGTLTDFNWTGDWTMYALGVMSGLSNPVPVTGVDA